MFKWWIRLFGKKERLTCIFEKDPASGGYTSHFAQFPNTYSQGTTKEEAFANLAKTLIAVIDMEQGDWSQGHNAPLEATVKKTSSTTTEPEFGLV